MPLDITVIKFVEDVGRKWGIKFLRFFDRKRKDIIVGITNKLKEVREQVSSVVEGDKGFCQFTFFEG